VPLKAVIPDPEWRERGMPRMFAQDALARFIAFHPAPFLIFASPSIASRARRFKPPTSPCRDAKTTTA
jgi:hypothetical protein